MKNKTITLFFKIVAIALVAFTISFQAKAQNKTTAVVNNAVTKNADVVSGPVADGTVRLVDNKGTIKYLQAKNGLTAITNKATDGTGVTTTWQLGGQLTDSTFIDVNGKAFVLDKIKLVTTAASASTDATDASSHGTGTGWTVLIRDEATGETKKIKAGDLLQVQGGQNVSIADAAFLTTPTYTIIGKVPNSIDKISVYRNGAKLVAGTDYTYTSPTVTLAPAATTYGEWALYVGDVIEIQWVK